MRGKRLIQSRTLWSVFGKGATAVQVQLLVRYTHIGNGSGTPGTSHRSQRNHCAYMVALFAHAACLRPPEGVSGSSEPFLFYHSRIFPASHAAHMSSVQYDTDLFLKHFFDMWRKDFTLCGVRLSSPVTTMRKPNESSETSGIGRDD